MTNNCNVVFTNNNYILLIIQCLQDAATCLRQHLSDNLESYAGVGFHCVNHYLRCGDMELCAYEHGSCSVSKNLCVALHCCGKIREKIMKLDEGTMSKMEISFLCKEHDIDKENIIKWNHYVIRYYV